MNIIKFKNFQKGLKLPEKIKPFLDEYYADLEYSLEYYYNEHMEMKEKMRKSFSINNYTPKRKFTEETMNRLYHGKKSMSNLMSNNNNSLNYTNLNKEYFTSNYNNSFKTTASMSNVRNCDNIAKFVENLVSCYYNSNKKYSNQENDLYEFWCNTPVDEKEKKNLVWEKGENNLYAELIGFFSEDAICERLYTAFENICGYRTYDTRPLHDYWVSLKIQEKFLKGLNKLNDSELYLILDEKKNQKKNEMLQKQKEEFLKKQKEEELKHKPKVEVYQRLMKKINYLAKAKDKWKTGNNMLALKKKFNYDNIIVKMIKQEFRENKEFRYPEQYALYDSDHERKVIFKNSIEKGIKKDDDISKIKEMIQKTKFTDDDLKKMEVFYHNQIQKENKEFDKCIKKNCILFYKKIKGKLMENKEFNKDQFFSELYQYCVKNHKNICKRLFPRRGEGIRGGYKARKKTRFNNYPSAFKLYFTRYYHCMNKDAHGKFIFAYKENLPFWAPTMKNNCKIHNNSSCPLYCTYNTFNMLITEQKNKSIQVCLNPKLELTDAERLNLWKRKDLLQEKQKIFLCFNEAEHCTFEPKINKKTNEYIDNEEIINKRISNKEWVNHMGHNFASSYPLVYKEGCFKKAKIAFQDGNFTETIKILSNAFDIDSIKAHFDPKYEIIYKKKLEEEKKKEKMNKNEMTSMFDNENNKKKQNIQPDNYKNGKNKEICFQIFSIVSEIESYKKGKEREAKKIEEELKIINKFKNESLNIKNNNIPVNDVSNKLANDITSKNYTQADALNKIKENFLKDRYFKFFKSIMCPLK